MTLFLELYLLTKTIMQLYAKPYISVMSRGIIKKQNNNQYKQDVKYNDGIWRSKAKSLYYMLIKLNDRDILPVVFLDPRFILWEILYWQ